MKGRITGLSAITLLLFALIMAAAVNIQVHRADGLNSSPYNKRNSTTDKLYPRGQILAANGFVLAKSIPTGDSTYKWRRAYPLGPLTSALVGFASTYNYKGKWGIEEQYNNALTAHAQRAQTVGQLLSPTIASDSVTLTLNIALQQIAARALAGRVGAVVALDPRDGSILAMYSNPTFNPAPLTSLSTGQQDTAWKQDTKQDALGFQPLNNLATQETFPPGSTMKVVTTASIYRYYPALATVNVPVRACLSFTPYSNIPLCNSGGSPCGGTVLQMLPASCDPGYGQLGIDLGAQDLHDQATQFGYNATPPIDLPLVNPSFFPSVGYLNQNGPPSLAYSAIGQQQVRATALQNALVAAGIANGGKVMAPHLLRAIHDAQGNLVTTYKPWMWRHPLGKVEASQIVPLMEDVVKFGTAQSVGFLPQDDVAAKTGTSQTSIGAVNTKIDAWMIAFAPAYHPLVAVAGVVPNQTLANWGATIAGPIVKCMVEGALAIDAGLPPTGTYTTCPK